MWPIFGGITTQFQVELDPHKLEQYGLSYRKLPKPFQKIIVSARREAMLLVGNLAYVSRGIGLVKDLNDLGKIVVKTEKGKRVPVFLNV